MFKLTLILAFFFNAVFAFSANSGDSAIVKKNNPKQDSINVFRLKKGNFDLSDSANFKKVNPYSLNHFEDYKFAGKLNFLSLGNWGIAGYSPLFKIEKQTPFVFNNAFEIYQKPMYYYSTDKPFTMLTYTNGQQKEQSFNLLHTQNFSPTWNVLFNFYKLNSDGFYTNQLNDHTLIRLNTNYLSKSRRLSGRIYFSHSTIKQNENGGLQNITNFKNNAFTNFNLYQTNFTKDINGSHSEAKNILAGVVLQYHFIAKSSADSDSTKHYKMSIGLQSFYHQGKKAYDDENTGTFYSNYFIDSLSTKDEINASSFDNGINFAFSPTDKIYLKYNADIEQISYKNLNFDSAYDNSYNQIKLKYAFNPANAIKVNGKYYFSGYKKADYNAKIRWEIRADTLQWLLPSLKIGAADNLSSIPIYYQKYYSNHFRWANNFSKMQTQKVFASLFWKKLKTKLSAAAGNIDGYIYFDQFALPRQLAGNLDFFKLKLHNKIKMGNVHLENIFAYQNFNQNQAVPLPNYVDKVRLYFQNKLFKHKLTYKIGASCFAYSDAYSYAYMPATSAFYLQNNIALGSYPYADFFIEIKLKRFRAFIKYENFGYWFMSNNFIQTPDYPYSPAALKFALSWGFVN